MPPVLYIQADNSPKDNKNRFVLMFLAMLVKAEIFKKVISTIKLKYCLFPLTLPTLKDTAYSNLFYFPQKTGVVFILNIWLGGT